ncbi:MAG: putative lipid II flippase FtsW [Acidobacteria bacterium]|nr:putative lipid II flippase FtsW [Acidobacteriota bacterium]MDW7985325.1 putative peptidoglycan glycosyltransferase FtsW [Acidobacteriota bacterium]
MRPSTGLLIVWGLLSGIGLLMGGSAPVLIAQERFGDPLFFLKRQVLYTLVGTGALFLAARVPYNFWVYPSVARAFFFGCPVLLIAVLWLPPVRGVHRWIRWGPLLSFQPSELAKLGIIIYIAFLVHRQGRQAFQDRLSQVAYAGLVTALWAVLIVREPDLGNALILLCIAGAMVFVGQVSLRQMALGAAVGAAVIGLAFLLWVDVPRHWKDRVLAFLDLEAHAQTMGYQQRQALIALGHGGLWGTGYGRSLQKLYYLPEPHNDYVFAILGEELGLPATLLVVALYMAYFGLGLTAARRARLPAGQVMALGIAVWICLQAFLNITVSVGLAPPKGTVLPFVSYGGTAYLLYSLATGILISIAEDNARLGTTD